MRIGFDPIHTAVDPDDSTAERHVIAEVGTRIEIDISRAEQLLYQPCCPGFDDSIADHTQSDIDIERRHNDMATPDGLHHHLVLAQIGRRCRLHAGNLCGGKRAERRRLLRGRFFFNPPIERERPFRPTAGRQHTYRDAGRHVDSRGCHGGCSSPRADGDACWKPRLCRGIHSQPRTPAGPRDLQTGHYPLRRRSGAAVSRFCAACIGGASGIGPPAAGKPHSIRSRLTRRRSITAPPCL